MTRPLDNTQNLLATIDEQVAADRHITLGEILDTIGRRSFGPIILVVGAFLAVPGLSDIPTVPTIFGALVSLIGIQNIFGRKHIWLPAWILNRSVAGHRVTTTTAWLKKPAQYVDTILKPRLTLLTSRWGGKAAAATCVTLALLTPLMEVVPFSANVAGVAFTFFGLGLIARDGLMNLFGFIVSFGVLGIGLQFFMSS